MRALAYEDVPTETINYDESSMPRAGDRLLARFVFQEDADAIEPLPPPPFPPLKELTWLSRLGQPPMWPKVPWAFVAAFASTLAMVAVGFVTR